MKINNQGLSGINPYKRQQNKLDQIESAAKKKMDKVEISTVAKDLQSISAYENERQEKVEKLKIQVENGTYKPNSTEIAKSILQFYKK